MKQKVLLILIFVLAITMTSDLFSYRNRKGNGGNRGNTVNNNYMSEAYINSLPIEEISAIEKEAILKMREEEKMARDVYMVLYERWGLRIFDNISQAEQRHMNSVKVLLTKYNIPDPVTEDTIGKFTDPEILKLYNQLIDKGNLSLTDALLTGATIEDVDIFDIQNYQLKVDNMDVLFVLGNLKKGSENHMRAFARQLNTYNIVYTAQFLTQEELDAILAVENENRQGRRGRRW